MVCAIGSGKEQSSGFEDSVEFKDGPPSIAYVIQHVIGNRYVECSISSGISWISKVLQVMSLDDDARSVRVFSSIPGDISESVICHPGGMRSTFSNHKAPVPQPASRRLPSGGISIWLKIHFSVLNIE